MERCDIEAAYCDAVYMVTLTVPAECGGDWTYMQHLWSSYLKDLANARRDDGRSWYLEFLRTVELTKAAAFHLHVLTFATGDFDPIVCREAWSYLSDIRLVKGVGWPLDNHINRKNAFRWSLERREEFDAKVERTTVRPRHMGAVRYVTKYVLKNKAEALWLGRGDGVRAFGVSNDLGANWKAVSVLMDNPDVEHCKAAVAAMPQSEFYRQSNNARLRAKYAVACRVKAGLETRPFIARRYAEASIIEPMEIAHDGL